MVASDESTPKETPSTDAAAKKDADSSSEEASSDGTASSKDVKAENKPATTPKAPPKKTAKKKTAHKKAASTTKETSDAQDKKEIETKSDAAPVTPTPSSQATSSSAGFPGGVIGLVVMLLLSAFGGGFVATQFAGDSSSIPVPDTSTLETQVERLQEDISELQAMPVSLAESDLDLAPMQEQLTTLEQRVAGLEQALLDMNDQASPVTVEDGIDSSELNALMDSFAQVNDDISILRNEIDANVSRRIAALEDTAPPADLEETLAALAPRQNLVALRQRLSALEQDETGSEAKQAALSLAIANLARASQMGYPFAQELEAITILSPDFSGAPSLSDVASTGLRRRDQLIADFGPTARSAFSAQWQSENASWWDSLMANLRGLVTVRQTGDVEGDSLEAIIARTETHLEKGNLTAALQEVQSIEGPAADVLSDWRTHLEAQLQLDGLMRELNMTLLQQFDEAED